MHCNVADSGQRADVLRSVRRVVLKVGTRLLTDMGATSKAERVSQLVAAIAELRQRHGLEVILVTSGAIGAGMTVLGTATRPVTLPQLQAHAAVGQSRLMYLYETACVAHGFHCGQLLLTAADVKDRGRHLNITSCLAALLGRGVLPVINENDSVSVDEIKFGDNDILAALVATMVRADLTVLLTSVDGMYDGDESRRLSVVPAVNRAVLDLAKGTDGNQFSVGGMISKLRAAALVTKAGESLWIADGRDFGNLRRVFAGEDVGTLFPASKATRMNSRKRFLAFFSNPKGALAVDAGAVRAIVEQGRSLLPSGITAIEGCFERGDTVRILGPDGGEVARGVSSYGSEDMAKIKGRRSAEIRAGLACDVFYDEAVHRDCLVVTS